MREFSIEYESDWLHDPAHAVRVVAYTDMDIHMSLIAGDEIVVESPEIEIIFDYPLSNEVVLSFSNDGHPFTRRDFWRAVYEGYTQIYREEDEVEGETGNYPGMLNRQHSDGPHGIWGHHIDDLFIEGVAEVKPNVFALSMGS